MPNRVNVQDVYTVVNAVAAEMFGKNTTIQAIDTSTFLTIGETMLRTGTEKVFEALSLVIGRTIVDIRPYTSAFKILTRSDMEYGNIMRIISYYTRDLTEATQSDNTYNASGTLTTPLKDGQSVDHYKINKVYPLEINFAGSKSLQKHYTRFIDQLKSAFRSESEFAAFTAGISTEMANEIEAINEAETTATLLGYMGALYQSDRAEMKVNVLAEFNADHSPATTYTIADVTTGTAAKEFYEWFIVYWKSLVKLMARQSVMYHQTPVKTDDLGNALTLLRHTPKSAVRAIMYEPFMMNAKAKILPEIFHPDYIEPGNYEGVMYWQNPTSKALAPSIKVKASKFDPADGTSKGNTAVNIPYVIGVVYDEKALAVSYKMEQTQTTPVNAGGLYYNTYYHWRKNYLANMTQNGVLLYMQNAS